MVVRLAWSWAEYMIAVVFCLFVAVFVDFLDNFVGLACLRCLRRSLRVAAACAWATCSCSALHLSMPVSITWLEVAKVGLCVQLCSMMVVVLFTMRACRSFHLCKVSGLDVRVI